MNFVRTRITKSLLAEQCSHSLMRNGRLVVGRKMPVVIPLRSVSHLMIRNDRVFSRSQAPCRGLSADAEKAAEAPKVEIADDSWAAEGLAKQGEKLASSADKPMVLIDDELIQGPPSATAKKLCDEILALNVVEVHQLLQLIQSRLGISDEMLGGFSGGGGGGGGGGAAAAAAAAPAAAEPEKVKDIFDIKLTVVDPKTKIKIIKEVRAITGLGLKEAKDLVEKAPCVLKTGIKKEEVDAITKVLTEAGAQVEVT